MTVGALSLSGCGGSGTTIPSLYEGTWAGTYDSVANPSFGTATVTVAEDGTVTGTGRNLHLGVDFIINGNIEEDGTVSGSISGGLSGTLNGTFEISVVNGHLVGAITQVVGSSTVVSNYDLTNTASM